MRNKFSYVPALAVGAAFGGIAVGAFDRCDREEELPSVVDSDMEVPEEAEVDPLHEEFCTSEDKRDEGFELQSVCVDEETSLLYADKERFDALNPSEQDQVLNETLTTFRVEMRRCIRKSAGKRSLELGIGYHIDPGLSAIMTFNCGGDDEGRVDYKLIAGAHGFVPDNNCMKSTLTLFRFLADQIVTLSQSTVTCYAADFNSSRFEVAQRIEVKDAGLFADDGFVHERRFTYRTPDEYAVAMGMAVDEEGEPLPALPGGPVALHALQGVLDDADNLFYSSESVFLHPSYVCPY